MDVWTCVELNVMWLVTYLATQSALMCNWVVQHQEKYKSRLVIAHYIGSTPASSELGKMLHRIMAEIKDAFKVLHNITITPTYNATTVYSLLLHQLEKEIPQEVTKLVEKFPDWLQEVHARGGCTIVLDAVNQLDPKYASQSRITHASLNVVLVVH